MPMELAGTSMTPKGTLVIDSGGEMARLVFSFDMKKHAGQYETIRAINNYTGTSERMNMIVRRLRDFRAAGWEVVLIFHEDIDKIYTRGSMVGSVRKGENNEPTAVKGRIDAPGSRTPEEIMRVADNIFRVRMVGNEAMWVCKPEPIGPGAPEPWQVKDRFHARSIGDFLKPSYAWLAEQAKVKKLETWDPPYIWIIYGAIGLGKTGSLETFPLPMHIFDLDMGTKRIKKFIDSNVGKVFVHQYNVEESDDYPQFMLDLEGVLEDPIAIDSVKKQLNIK